MIPEIKMTAKHGRLDEIYFGVENWETQNLNTKLYRKKTVVHNTYLMASPGLI